MQRMMAAMAAVRDSVGKEALPWRRRPLPLHPLLSDLLSVLQVPLPPPRWLGCHAVKSILRSRVSTCICFESYPSFLVLGRNLIIAATDPAWGLARLLATKLRMY